MQQDMFQANDGGMSDNEYHRDIDILKDHPAKYEEDVSGKYDVSWMRKNIGFIILFAIIIVWQVGIVLLRHFKVLTDAQGLWFSLPMFPMILIIWGLYASRKR